MHIRPAALEPAAAITRGVVGLHANDVLALERGNVSTQPAMCQPASNQSCLIIDPIEDVEGSITYLEVRFNVPVK